MHWKDRFRTCWPVSNRIKSQHHESSQNRTRPHSSKNWQIRPDLKSHSGFSKLESSTPLEMTVAPNGSCVRLPALPQEAVTFLQTSRFCMPQSCLLPLTLPLLPPLPMSALNHSVINIPLTCICSCQLACLLEWLWSLNIQSCIVVGK